MKRLRRAGSALLIGVTLLLAAGGTASAGTADPANVDFGNVPINTTVTQDVAITVDAGYRVQIASGTGLNAPFSFNFDTCGAEGGFTGPGTCTVKQSYRPTSATSSNATTNVFQCPVAGGTCIPISYTMNGTGVSTAAANPGNVDFGNVPINTTVTQDVAITVDAGYRVQIASGTGLNAPFSFNFDTCGAEGGFTGPGTCTVKQSYRPTSATSSNATTNVFQCPVAGGTCIPISYTMNGTGAAAPTSTALTSSANPSLPGQAVTFTARVSVPAGAGDPTGTVTFTDGGTLLGTVALSGGVATLTTSTLALGSHDIQASYSGGGAFEPSSAGLTQVVRDTTTTALTSSLNPSLTGQAVTFTATVASGSGAVVPTGTVTFTDGATVLGTVALAGGSASFTTSTLGLGQHAIQATYNGATGLGTSSASLTQSVQDTTSTALTSSANPSVQGDPVTFTARVTPTSGVGVPTGTVVFRVDSTVVGTVALSGGVATLTTATLSPGTHTVTASYGGDTTYRPSSASLAQVVQGVTALLADLADDVAGAGPGNGLSAKVQSIQASLAAGQLADACSTLGALSNQISAQSGKSLTAAQAAELTAQVDVIRSLIPCA